MDSANKQPDSQKQPTSPDHAESSDKQRIAEQLATERKRRRSRPILVSLLTILLIGLGAFLAWYVMTDGILGAADTSNDDSSDQQQDIARVHDAAWAIEQIATVFDGSSNTIERPLLAVQTSGNDFATDAYDVDAYAGTTGSVPAEERDLRVAEIGKVLTDDDFTATISRTNDETIYSARYFGRDAACVIDSQGSRDNQAADHALQVACIDMVTLNEIAENQVAFYEAASDKTNVAGAALLASPQIEESSTDGYQRATLQIGPANLPGGIGTMYFYQTPNTQQWAYVTTVGDAGPGGIQCEALDEAGRIAYRGETCYKNRERSRVE